MYYYKKKGKDIIKYEIVLDEEKLRQLKLEIIEKCSYIKHINSRETSFTISYRIDFKHVRNYNEKFIRTIEYNDFYSQPEDEYLVDYDYYEYPILVSYIDEILKGNTSIIGKIEKLKDKNMDKENIILEEQQKIINKLNNPDNKNKQELINLLNESQEKLLEYYKEKELNKNQVPSSKYKRKVLNLITMKEIGTMPYKTILEVQKFFISSIELNKENNLNKVLKLNQ